MEATIPQNLDAEVCVLGSMLLDSRCIPRVRDLISADDFHRPAHAHIFRAIIGLYETRIEIELVTLKDELVRQGVLEQVGGTEYLVEIFEGTPGASNAEYYAKVVKDKSGLRTIISDSATIQQAAFDPSATFEQVRDNWQAKAYALDAGPRPGVADLKDATTDLMMDLQSGKRGIPLGIPELDFATGGLREGNYMIIGGWPGVGKTFLALNITFWLCERTSPLSVLFISCEMSKGELTERLFGIVGGIHLTRLRNRRLTKEETQAMSEIKTRLDKWKLRFDCQSHTVPAISSSIRRFITEVEKPALVIVDYVQLLSGPGTSRYDQYTEISKGLKHMAGQYEVPLLVLSQLRRPPPQIKNPRPTMQSLKETGGLEQDADGVLLLLDSQPPGGDSTVLWACLAKNRHGPALWWPDQTEYQRLVLPFDRTLGRFTPGDQFDAAAGGAL